MREYATNKNIIIVGEFAEAETAKTTGRAKFNEMIQYLAANEDTRIILVEKVDRLYRNLLDYGTIDSIKNLEIHFVKENEIVSEKSRSSIKFFTGMKVLMAKQYIDNLAEESKKGINERVEQGYALYPPIGYKYGKDGNRKNAIVVDEERAAYAQKAFDLFVNHNLSADAINDILYKDGLRNRNGKKYARSTIHRIFHNVMYVGDFKYEGVYRTDCKHTALISREMFQKAQEKLGNVTNTTRQHDIKFPYIGLFRCGVCGCTYTAERKVKPSGKEFIYYHCTGKGKIKTCKKDSYINQTKVDKIIATILKGLEDMPQSLIDEINQNLKELHYLKNSYSKTSHKNIEKQIKELNRKINNAYERMVSASPATKELEENLWNENHPKWFAEREELRQKQTQIDKADEEYYRQSDLIIKFCKDAHDLFLKSDANDKRTICEIIGSNFVANGKEIDITMFPIFYDIISMKDLKLEKNTRFEPPETQATHTKKDPINGSFLNGGNDEARTRDLMRDRHAL